MAATQLSQLMLSTVVVRYSGPALLLPPNSSSSSDKEKQTQSCKCNREGRARFGTKKDALTLPSEGKSKEPEVDLPLMSEHLLKIALSHYLRPVTVNSTPSHT
ncbi:hypothetical protein DFH08DRAFT_817194 [Mycena albidolilacea]|uniref:Uncharacterized protein n=1 Tax=Mycena albidolilacea TaxID=1033008 RepID=A0AAD6ZIT9_9AGAR|nr:hypothetical protein DFH08DRAFT_817194 [Mycena albidolilacea]